MGSSRCPPPSAPWGHMCPPTPCQGWHSPASPASLDPWGQESPSHPPGTTGAPCTHLGDLAPPTLAPHPRPGCARAVPWGNHALLCSLTLHQASSFQALLRQQARLEVLARRVTLLEAIIWPGNRIAACSPPRQPGTMSPPAVGLEQGEGPRGTPESPLGEREMMEQGEPVGLRRCPRIMEGHGDVHGPREMVENLYCTKGTLPG